MLKWTKYGRLTVLAGVLALVLTGCGSSGGSSASGSATGGTSATLSGDIAIDGSSTVTPILEAVTEEFAALHAEVNPTTGTSGTGGGFKKFATGDIDIAMASRPIKEEEIAMAKEAGIEFIEVPVAFDGLTVVVNPKNTFATTLTVAELNKIWAPDSTVNNWSQVRPGFPDLPIKLYGAGTDSGTFDYFTLAINGEEGSSRADYQASEDDNVLVQGVAGDEGALGYFGYAYYKENSDKLTSVQVDGGNGPVAPGEETILDGTYQPLSRPLFIYVNKASLDSKPALKEFVRFLLQESGEAIASTGYVPMSDELNAAVWALVEEGKTGTRFAGAEIGMKMSDILAAEGK